MTRICLLTKCLTFDKIPTVLDSFKHSSLIWLFHVKLESNVMPRYLVESTCLIGVSLILILNDWLGLSLLEWKRMKLVLEILSANRLHFILSATDFSSQFRVASSLSLRHTRQNKTLRWFLRNKSCRWIFLKLSPNVLYQALFRKKETIKENRPTCSLKRTDGPVLTYLYLYSR